LFYSIRHLTKFRYSEPVSESIMEARMQPRSEANQRCLSFQLNILPRTRVQCYRDYLGNMVHHFDVPGRHRQLAITAEALVDVQPPPEIPEDLGSNAWDELKAQIAAGDFWEMLTPSHFARPSPAIEDLARDLDLASPESARERDPLRAVLQLNGALSSAIAYGKKSTRVDSPIDDALRSRKGVCQDFAHIMITLARRIGIPARYVSGYLFQRDGDNTRSSAGATHAWVETYLPGLGWTGFDPTNNVAVGDRHVRTAVGRDYADVPPTRGVYKGHADSELSVAVRVAPSDAPPPPETELPGEDWSAILQEEAAQQEAVQQQQQQ